MKQPLVRKLFELAERLHIPAFELAERLTLKEVELWAEYDRVNVPQTSVYFSGIMTRLDKLCGFKPDPSRYLPKTEHAAKRPRTPAEIRANFEWAVVASARLKR